MAEIDGNLWQYNLARVLVVDVTDDYELMQPPLPTECYPVILEKWLPRHKLREHLPDVQWLDGYLYDWHQTPAREEGYWVVAVVRQDALDRLFH